MFPALKAVRPAYGVYRIAALSKEAAIDGKAYEIYVTVTTKDPLLYNHGDETGTLATPQGEISVPPHDVISLPRIVLP